MERGSGPVFRATTIVAVRGPAGAAMAGDGQVTFGEHTVIKQNARKVRRLWGGKVLAGFAGAAADGFTLFEKFEAQLEAAHGNLLRASVEMAKEWRTDRVLRRLEALLLVMDRERLLLLSGTGELVEPDDQVAAIGSGGPFALAAARALVAHTTLTPAQVAEEALRIAADICIYTNNHIVVEAL